MLVKLWLRTCSWNVSTKNVPKKRTASAKVSWASGEGCLGTSHGQALPFRPEVRELSDISACLQSTGKPNRDLVNQNVFLGFSLWFCISTLWENPYLFLRGMPKKDRTTIASPQSSGLQSRRGLEISPFLELKLFWQKQSFLRGVWVCMSFFRKCPPSSSSGRQLLDKEGSGKKEELVLPLLWLMGQSRGLTAPAPMSCMLGGSGDSRQQTELCSHQHQALSSAATQSIKHPPQAIPSGQNSGGWRKTNSYNV